MRKIPIVSRCSQFLAAAIAAIALLTPSAQAWTTGPETVLYAFHGADGSAPYQLVEGANGTVFALKPPARGTGPWTFTLLASIPTGVPGNLAILPTGAFAFYGSVPNGGLPGPYDGSCDVFGGYGYGCGSVFLVTPPAGGRGPWTTRTIYQFTGGGDGGEPYAIVQSGGSLFGLVGAGGNADCHLQTGCGGAFHLAPPQHGQRAWTESLPIGFFPDFTGDPPVSAILGTGVGDMYGLVTGEVHAEPLSVFSERLGNFTSFDSGSEGSPQGVVVDANGTVYVWTSTSFLYALPPPTFTHEAIYHLPASGATVLLAYHGGVYGVYAPTGKRASIVALLPAAHANTAWGAHFLYTFTGGSDGAKPNSLLFAKSGDLYGTASAGGLANKGVIFRLSMQHVL
jgi:uncharacterized repeat protein (TIGR03803 family)